MSSVTIVEGHVLTALRARPAESVHCVVTSPPYWGLRDYGTEPQVWGGSEDCSHEWGARITQHKRGKVGDLSTLQGGEQNRVERAEQGAFCQLCGAWRGHLGLEPTPELYVAHLVAVFREVWRVLRKDGTCWLVIGDSYMASSKGQGGKTHSTLNAKRDANGDLADDRKSQPWMDSALRYDLNLCGLKAKDLVGIPWRVAFALQADGWWLRSDVVWSKLNPMPESVDGTRWEQHRVHVIGPDGKKQYVDCPGCEKCLPNDGLVLRWGSGRPTRSHEYVFPLAKSARYFYDAEAVKESNSPTSGKWGKSVVTKTAQAQGNGTHGSTGFMGGEISHDEVIDRYYTNGRNRRSVWTIATQPFAGAHFAAFPEKLVEPCVLAGTSERGCCPKCGAPWVRAVEQVGQHKARWKAGASILEHEPLYMNRPNTGVLGTAMIKDYTTIGWRPSCDCDAGEPVPCTVLDPFLGSGRTALVAAKLGRDCVGIELKGGYCEMAERQVREGLGMLVEVRSA